MLKAEKDVSLETIAKSINSNKSSLSMFINGKQNIKKDMLDALASYFDVDVAYLLGESDIRRQKQTIPSLYIAVCKDAYEKGISAETIQGFIEFYEKNRPPR